MGEKKDGIAPHCSGKCAWLQWPYLLTACGLSVLSWKIVWTFYRIYIHKSLTE